ncbi:hypothetical protein D3874_18055 [Oleomonas cavernae]|uniref:Uncharacterized protein n=1 Tax=Oleomonas cavernae TaxID=2320859 RepID=A0A418WF53_9PROT|nr:hypothetical protein [Oleomonas cavernae]RJF88658.1 hypothetical protein D3874_18055 [Oleomonas cavernae]
MARPIRDSLRLMPVVLGFAGFLLAGCETPEETGATAAAPEASAPAPEGRPLAEQFFAGAAGFCAELISTAKTMGDAVAIGDRTGFRGGMEDPSRAPAQEIKAVSVDLEGQKMFWTATEGIEGQIQTFVLLPTPVDRCRVALLDSLDAAEATIAMLQDEDSGWIPEKNPPAPVDGIRSFMFYKLSANGAVGINITMPEQIRPEYGRLVAMATVFRARAAAVPTE